MKLPVYKNLAKSASNEAMENALEVLEIYADSPAVKEDERDAIGEIISNICGAMEMKSLIENGMAERDAANHFMQRVLSSIDK